MDHPIGHDGLDPGVIADSIELLVGNHCRESLEDVVVDVRGNNTGGVRGHGAGRAPRVARALLEHHDVAIFGAEPASFVVLGDGRRGREPPTRDLPEAPTVTPTVLRGLAVHVPRVAFRVAVLPLLALRTPGAPARQRGVARLQTDIRRGHTSLAGLRGEGGRLQRTRSDEAEQQKNTDEHGSTPLHGITLAREQSDTR
jgi:hypothetical protein